MRFTVSPAPCMTSTYGSLLDLRQGEGLSRGSIITNGICAAPLLMMPYGYFGAAAFHRPLSGEEKG